MIAIHTAFRVDPDRLDAFGKQFIEMSQSVRDEAGCILYKWFPDPESDDKCHAVSVWESEETLAAHRAHPQHVEHMRTLEARGVLSFTSHYCTISSVESKETSYRDSSEPSEGTRK
jgi:quinol monooxygenase YgiN